MFHNLFTLHVTKYWQTHAWAFEQTKLQSSYSWRPIGARLHNTSHHPPLPSAESTHSLCPPYPMLSLETSTPAHGFLVPFHSLRIISLFCWTICSPHCFNRQESLMRALFSQWFFFILIIWVWEIISNLTLLSNEIISNSILLSANDSLTQSTVPLQWWLFPDSSWRVMRESKVCIGVFQPMCVSVVQQFILFVIPICCLCSPTI